jgi:hypothetical protein
LVVDTNAVLSLSVPCQHFKSVSGQGGEVSQGYSRFQSIQLQARNPFNP